jgi:LmbE family N-acetylglucosaminyl deacetylase
VHTVIHASPHPDDESIAAPCTLLALKDAGWRVINFAASLGRPADRPRRRRELEAALGLAGFEHRESGARMGISRGDDLHAACRALTAELTELVNETGAELVVGPHPRDGHHGHAAVARAVRQTVWRSKRTVTWWMWPLWTDLPRPTLIVDCDDKHLRLSKEMLERYEGENARNDYPAMHEAIRVVNAVRGVEKVFGLGTARDARVAGIRRAELLTEVTVQKHRWMVGVPRVLDPENAAAPGWVRLDDLSIMSASRLRPFYNPWALWAHARFSIPGRVVRVAPLPAPDPDAR